MGNFEKHCDVVIHIHEQQEKGVIPVEASSEDDILRRLWDDPNEDPQYVAAKLSQLN
ncbi:MAG: hypothetical protein N4A44_03120 [Alphaproteobacteria bacterium]|jgi:hypothetical protein|nr:hypothetical protein [Alphaproteobacteria bacterium]